ncbi:hypothetical protein WMF45_24325 [Sorangium sp. So ce448]|uniref:hypothetical protein n=1 Tax=Sorangium sp. So ce448 TaxID=3133314 RepID=UPI003F63B00D
MRFRVGRLPMVPGPKCGKSGIQPGDLVGGERYQPVPRESGGMADGWRGAAA